MVAPGGWTYGIGFRPCGAGGIQLTLTANGWGSSMCRDRPVVIEAQLSAPEWTQSTHPLRERR